jgi:hypothetical protein
VTQLNAMDIGTNVVPLSPNALQSEAPMVAKVMGIR